MDTDRSAPMRILRLLGIDRSIAYVVGGRLWVLVGGVVTVLMVVRFLSATEQGFYYTFSSLVGLQVFFELGLAYVVLQFASHERAFLSWTARRTLEGSQTAKERLASLLRFSLFWYGAVALLVVAIVLPVGWLVLASNQFADGIAWRLPWVLTVCVTALSLLITPLLALIEGSGHVARVAAFRSVATLVGSLATWVALLLGLALFAVPVTSAVWLMMAVLWLAARYRNFFMDLASEAKGASSISWRHEIMPFQWRIGVSSLSGYFIFQLFTPVLFAFQGATVAGRMGMSLALFQAISAIAMAWVTTKSPTFGVLVARREYSALDEIFFATLLRSMVVVGFLCATAWLAVVVLGVAGTTLAARILAPVPLALLLSNAIINQVVFSFALYLRAHKREPFLIPSIVSAILCGACVYVLGRFTTVTIMLLGYVLVNAIAGLLVGGLVFRSRRRAWHDLNGSGCSIVA